jgi:hypothetical protein
MFLKQKPFITVLVILAIEYLQFRIAPAFLVDFGVEVVDVPACLNTYLSRH